jgi:hypothetical protein
LEKKIVVNDPAAKRSGNVRHDITQFKAPVCYPVLLYIFHSDAIYTRKKKNEKKNPPYVPAGCPAAIPAP